MDEMALANEIIKRHRTNNPFEICDNLNYLILYVPLIGVRGFYQFYDNRNIIYIDCNLPDQVKKFVCAHELGHSLMHKDINAIFLDTRTYLKTSIYERQANQFAINLLYPHDKDFDEYRDYTISQTAKCLNVSEELVEYRLKEIRSWTQEGLI